jgi:hypothetical protein
MLVVGKAQLAVGVSGPDSFNKRIVPEELLTGPRCASAKGILRLRKRFAFAKHLLRSG